MTATAPIDADDADLDRKAEARAVLQRQVEMLGELAEIGMNIARAIGRQAAGDNDDTPGDDPLAMAFARVARAVRLTLMLQAKALEDLRRASLPELASPRPSPAPSPEDVRKARVERIVQRVARAAHGEDAAEIDRLMIEASERLDDEDLCRDILTRPLGDLVAAICRDLGLDPDWARLSREPWACDEAGDPRSPFAAMAPFPVAAHPRACSP